MSSSVDIKGSHKVIIVSSDDQMAEALSRAVVEAKMDQDPRVLSDYPSPAALRGLLESDRDPIGAVIIDLKDPASALDLVRELKRSHPDVVLAAADRSASAEQVLAAMRAGVSEFLQPPFDLGHLRQNVSRRAASKSAPSSRGRLICCVSAQEGSGASTVALHAADAISRQLKERALLVDFDFHAGTIAFRLRLEPEYTLLDALERTSTIDELWDNVACKSKEFDVLAPPPSGSSISPEMLDVIPDIFDSATRVYPCVIVDCPAALFLSSRGLFARADEVYVVSTTEMMSLFLAKRRVSELASFGVSDDKLLLLLNRVTTEKKVDTERIEKLVGVPVSWMLGNDYAALSDASLKGGLVPRDSMLGRQFVSLGCKVMGIELPRTHGATGKWRSIFSVGKTVQPQPSAVPTK